MKYKINFPNKAVDTGRVYLSVVQYREKAAEDLQEIIYNTHTQVIATNILYGTNDSYGTLIVIDSKYVDEVREIVNNLEAKGVVQEIVTEAKLLEIEKELAALGYERATESNSTEDFDTQLALHLEGVYHRTEDDNYFTIEWKLKNVATLAGYNIRPLSREELRFADRHNFGLYDSRGQNVSDWMDEDEI